jgi:hypothetical protein
MPTLLLDNIPSNLRDLPLLTAADRALLTSYTANAQVVCFDANNPLARPFRMGLAEFLTSAALATPTLTTPTIAGALKSTTSTRTGVGAIDVTSLVTEIVTTGANALTLADGVDGQIKILAMKTDGGDGTLTPATKTGFTTITFDTAGDGCVLVFTTTTGWICVANNGCTLA